MRNKMKIQKALFVTAISGMMALCSCSKEVINDNEMVFDSQLTVLTRTTGEEGEEIIATPVRLYVFDSKSKCVAAKTEDGSSATFSVPLAKGTYDVYAIGGAEEERFVLPSSEEEAEKTFVISLKEDQEFGDLMAGHSNIALTSKNKTLTMNLERKVCQIVDITISNVPTGTEDVSVSISPFYESILLNGEYQGENGSRTIELNKLEDGTTWTVEPNDIFLLPSVGKPTISIKIDDTTYSYTCEKEMTANYKISINGTYTGTGEIPSITLSGTITGTAWAGDDTIKFNFNEDGSETVSDNSNTGEGVIDADVPTQGSLYEGCYVLAVDGKQVTILSSKEEQNIITSGDNNQNVIKQKVDDALEEWSVPNITTTWKLPDSNIAVIIHQEKSNINSPELGSKGYFLTANSKIMAFSVNGKEINYSITPSDIVYLRPVATLTFK